MRAAPGPRPSRRPCRLDRRLDGTDRDRHFDRARAAAQADAPGEGGCDVAELSGGRFTLGIGMGWHRHEFEFMGVEFKGRGRRADEAIRVMRALWSGERDFEGDYWSFHDAMSEPHPSPQPEIWVGGSSERAIRRALELGDVWHPSRGSDPEHVRRVREQHPELRVIPRVAGDNAEEMLQAGADGAVVQFPDQASMRAFVARSR
jgi:alkanesulfonate monooxygenase SsuD/methylene tetrahydromethanopterin reductase-like flavin-dependent oxidoreductase (luciferase family)